MTALDILLENTRLQLIFGGIAAFVAFSWVLYQILEARERAEWRQAAKLREANTPKPKWAKRGGSTGNMTPFQAVFEVAQENKKIENYDPHPAENFALRVWEASLLFNPQRQSEWVWGSPASELFEVCDFIESLGCHEIAERLRDFEPYQTWVQSFFARDEDPPENSPETNLYYKQAKWLDKTNAWQKVLEKVNARLLDTYPWDDDGEAAR